MYSNVVYMYDENGARSGFTVIAEGKSFGVPLDPANRHYAEIMRLVDAGELTIQEPSE